MIKDLQKIPAGWKKIKLGEVFKSNMPGAWGNEPRLEEDAYPVISTLAIDYEGNIDFSNYTLRSIDNQKIEKLLLKKYDILLEKSGGSSDTPAGKVALVKNDFRGTCSNFIQILKVKEVNNPVFVFYRLFYDFKNKKTEKYQQKTTGIVNFKVNDYFNETFSLPPLPEQEKIAEILETVDNTIEKTDAIIEKYKRTKQGLMQELLTKGIDINWHIRSEKTHQFKDSPLGRIPADWEVKKLGEIGKSFAGGTPSSGISEYYNGDIKWLKSGEINSKYIYNTEETLTSSGLRNSNAKWIEGNTVVIAMYGATAGQVGIVKTKMTANQAVLALSINEKERVYFEYLYYSLLVSVNLLLSNLQGSGQPNLNKGNIDNLIIALPPLPEQERIASVLSQVDTVIEKETAYRDKLSRIKQGLMEDLLTGKVRVTTLLENKNNQYQKEVL